MTSSHITRFAPSPTGRLHLGHAFSALLGRGMAGRGGRWLLRIDDIDTIRCRPEYIDSLHGDLGWLGLCPDGELRQSERMDAYEAALDRLRARNLLYPCFCTRADIVRANAAPHAGETSRYPGTCRQKCISADELAVRPHAWRLDLGATGLPMRQRWRDLLGGEQSGLADTGGDPVLARKEMPTSYHLSCVIDDAAMGVTLVSRGADLTGGTALQRLLQQLLDLPEPLYLHHPLLLDDQGRRLAKRDGAVTLAALRAKGETASHIREMLMRRIEPILSGAGIDKTPPESRAGGAAAI